MIRFPNSFQNIQFNIIREIGCPLKEVTNAILINVTMLRRQRFCVFIHSTGTSDDLLLPVWLSLGNWTFRDLPECFNGQGSVDCLYFGSFPASLNAFGYEHLRQMKDGTMTVKMKLSCFLKIMGLKSQRSSEIILV